MQLAKLLAKENVTVQYGNYKTAWFDIKNRTLGLPMWKDMGKDVQDLLVGHEVGHALETPYEGWHDSPEKLEGCPRSYINVIEDARIERKVKTRYPGLVGPFSRGYKKLVEDGFFGDNILDTDWEEVKLIDKINLKAKIGNLIDVPFTKEEKVFYDRAMSTDDFAEVLQLVKDILAWTKENQEELIQPEMKVEQEESEGDQNDDASDGHDDLESDKQETIDENNTKGSNGDDAETEEQEDDNQESVSASEPKHSQDDVSVTDEIFRSKEKNLLDTNEGGGQSLLIREVPKHLQEKVVTPYSKLKELRQAKYNYVTNCEESYYHEAIQQYENTKKDFPQFLKGVKKNIQFAVKEFEQRKAATQWQKASVSKTGNLDVNKLWSYKTNDDIFLRTTRLADSKNHGMMMVVDFSGSMSSSMKYVLDQVIHTVMFCKAVNIPFEVYAFSSTNDIDWKLYKDGDMDLDDCTMPQLTSSTLSKSDFEESIRFLYMRTVVDHWTVSNFLAKCEDYGSTPLNQALVIIHDICKKFKTKNNIEKMNLITFTDGDANSVRVVSDRKLEDVKLDSRNEYYDHRDGYSILIDGKIVKAETKRQITKKLLENLGKRYGINTIGFFMADCNHAWNSKLGDICWSSNKIWEDWRAEARKEYTKNKCVEVHGYSGYNTYYLVKGNQNLDTAADDFDVNEDATKGQIGTAFKKYSKSKKLNKVLMTKFGAAVA